MSDNGPPFNGIEFEEFCRHFGIKNRKITPVHPQANGQRENFMRNIYKIIRNSFLNARDSQLELQDFLRNYRSTPHSSTGIPPAELLFQKANTSRLPKPVSKENELHSSALKQALTNDERSKAKMKKYSDNKRKAIKHSLSIGDTVLIHQNFNKPVSNKKLTKFSKQPLTVTATKGSMITAREETGRTATRNAVFFKKCTAPALQKAGPEIVYEPEFGRSPEPNNPEANRTQRQAPTHDGNTVVQNTIGESPNTSPTRTMAHVNSNESNCPTAVETRRPTRERKQPERYDPSLFYKNRHN